MGPDSLKSSAKITLASMQVSVKNFMFLPTRRSRECHSIQTT